MVDKLLRVFKKISFLRGASHAGDNSPDPKVYLLDIIRYLASRLFLFPPCPTARHPKLMKVQLQSSCLLFDHFQDLFPPLLIHPL